jgi:hypothetical protein
MWRLNMGRARRYDGVMRDVVAVSSLENAGRANGKAAVSHQHLALHCNLLMLLVVALGTGSIVNAEIPVYLSRHADLPRGIDWMNTLSGPAWVGIAMGLAAILTMKRAWISSHRIDRVIDWAALGAMTVYVGFLTYVYHTLKAEILRG